MASYAKLQRLSRRSVLLAVVYALLQQLLNEAELGRNLS